MVSAVGILGRSDHEIGDQLEQLVTELLGAVGYGDFVRNAYKTGAEIDLRATHRVTRTTILVECKARVAPTSAPALRLFHSEYVKQRAKEPRLHGLFVSTSGFTGTARSWHDELDKRTREAFTLIGPDDIMSLLAGTTLLLSREAIAALVHERHRLPAATDYILTASRYGLAWIVAYAGGKDVKVIVLDAHGAPLENWKCRQVLRLLGGQYRRAKLFGLDVRRKIELALLKEEKLTATELTKRVRESSADVVLALSSLVSAGRLVEVNKQFSFVRDVVKFIDLAADFLRSTDSLAFFRSDYSKEMAQSAELLTYIDGRYRLGLTADEADTFRRVLAISPSALAYSLFTDPKPYLRTYEHIHELKNSTEQDGWLRQHAWSLPREAFFEAVHDFTSRNLSLAGHLASLGVKRTRIQARLDLVGTPAWPKFSVDTGSMHAIEKAGGAIEAGSLISYTEPAEFDAWNGMFHLQMEEWADAEAAFQKALSQVKPSTPRDVHQAVLNNLGLVYLRQKRWADGAKKFETALSLGTPDWPAPFTNLLTCLMEEGQVQRAAEIVNIAVQAFPELASDAVLARYRAGWPSENAG